MTKYALAAGIAVLFALPSGIAIYALREVHQLQAAVTGLQNQISPSESYAMRSIGTGGDGENPYIEWVGLYPESTLYPITGAPSLRFKDQSPEDATKPRDFEIGFYKYGPTWFTTNDIIEFWIGGDEGGIFSVAGNGKGGGEIQVRNPTDTDSIQLNFYDPDRPTILTESGLALHFSAHDGLVSDDTHTFAAGLSIPSSSGYAGQVIHGRWRNGRIIVPTDAITGDSIVLITPLSRPKGRWWVSDIEDKHTFTVTSTAINETMDFNWMIISSLPN